MLTVLTYLVAFTAVKGFALNDNETCESTGQINHFDWDVLMGDDFYKPAMSYDMNVDQATLTLELDAELEYVGYAYADDHTYGYGTTYVLDFEDFNAESDDIRLPGNCQNRQSGDFGGSFSSLWVYSHTPKEIGHIDAAPYLSYPPSGDNWDLDIVDDCSPIKYHGEFSWTELRNCGNFGGSDTYTRVKTDANWINLTGVFYINLVSPLAHYTDTQYYRVYQMLSAPFVIAVRNSVNIISSVGINLFTLSIIAVYKEDLESDFRLIVLTESADFLMLSAPQLLETPSNNGLGALNWDIVDTSLNTGCLTASANLCSQLWEIYANNVTCPPTNFTGLYSLQYTTVCNPDANYTNNLALCNNYINEYGDEVGLNAHLEWLDEICDPEIFIIQFDGTMHFYNDSSFIHELGTGDQYTLGDTAYVEVHIELPSNTYNVFDVNLNNVWVCTTSPDHEPLTVEAANLGTGGCLSANIDDGFPWHIVISGVDNDLTNGGDVVLYQPYQNASMKFSFFIDSSISRVNLYVQAQVTITLAASGTRRRMRALLQTDTASATRHFDGATGIGGEVLVPEEILDDDDVVGDATNPETTDTPVWITAGVCVGIANLLLFGVCLFVYCYKKKGNNKTQDIINIMKQMQDNKEAKNNDVKVVVEPKPVYDLHSTPAATSNNTAATQDKGFPQTA